MCCQYLKKYRDFIGAYENLYHIKADQFVEEISNLVETVLICKYKVPIHLLFMSIFNAIKYNYRSIVTYVNMLNIILNKHSFKYKDLLQYKTLYVCGDLCSDEIHECLQVSRKSNTINQIEFDTNTFPKEDEIQYVLMNDQVDKFREYVTQHPLESISIRIPCFVRMDPIEACCYFGSVNIFFFIISNYEIKISDQCYQYSFIGGNIDIINEITKNNKIDEKCFSNIVASHNNQCLDYVFERDLFDPEFINGDLIIKSQNLKIVFMLLEKHKDLIIPWCAAFPQTIDILMNENIDISKISLIGCTAIHYASVGNCKEIAEFLISHGVDINVKNDYNETALHYSPYKETTEVLISHGIDINWKQKHGYTALHLAANINSEEVVELLLSHGADVNAKDKEGETPLHHAAKNNCKETAEFLISHGADVNAKDKNNKTPLHKTTTNNCKETAEILISHGVDVNSKDKEEKTPLHHAAKNNSIETAEYLISHGADVNAKDKDGNPPIYWAIMKTNKDIIRLLIEHGADIKLKNKHGRNILHWATEVWDPICIVLPCDQPNIGTFRLAKDKSIKEVLEILILCGIDINSKDKYGNTPLHLAAYGKLKITVEFLIANGANVNARNNVEKTPLHLATKGNGKKVAEMLLCHGADINAKDAKGNTSLCLNAHSFHQKITNILISHGADINSKNNDGWTALHIAIKEDQTEISKILISHGADVNVKENKGNTPLHFAAKHYRQSVIELLLSNGADINPKNKDGKTPLHYAVKTCYKK
ncbi:ankyrin repeat protein, putative [Trichomonas vaginalis G3]|uniref:Ankyrin repeat protein, putative n=1 Tax=Trichomonas vaginalis (strain ATCC PRA-98 / G3) TaxID=412133 RepID=A2ER16_TRIV3|nr:cyclin-dependent kinase inhibitor 2C-related family [Trichomonas vaginalis G3]EAY04906.1 ankyrin repeat protein, putative [Trichomonas vaginalis G3]KAI5519436.1 cyclin-dependent kinase inhibitor 2C-related family [Trichomonas vaginalis G3]|eukprot:XP_001317129.1 ankyrin repeat protein [Trichomonas vaginalis G3]